MLGLSGNSTKARKTQSDTLKQCPFQIFRITTCRITQEYKFDRIAEIRRITN